MNSNGHRVRVPAASGAQVRFAMPSATRRLIPVNGTKVFAHHFIRGFNTTQIKFNFNIEPLAGDAKVKFRKFLEEHHPIVFKFVWFICLISQYPTLFKTPTLSTVSEDCLV